ncbi:MAG: fructose-6-phosphate aldolase [Dehalococcoidia bacterium]|nr:fructose-6-phosphate aldolase [Dehalococcoidia bacterium]
MELFLDTANLDEIRQAVRIGVISGVTTNPSLAAKEGIGQLRVYQQQVQEIAQMVSGPISAEVISTDYEGMVLEAREIASWAPNVVAKIPSTMTGFEAIATLSREGIKINQTLCFSVNQAILGARAGSAFVSPFVGRLDDEGHDGMQVVADIVEIFKRYNITTKVLVASIRHPLHCVAAAKAGAHIATVPFKVLTQMAHHPLTDVGVARFAEDWKNAARV